MVILAETNPVAAEELRSFLGAEAKVPTDDEFAACFLGASVYVEENIRATKADLARFAPRGGRDIELHVTEYGPLVYPLGKLKPTDELPWNRSLAGALYPAVDDATRNPTAGDTPELQESPLLENANHPGWQWNPFRHATNVSVV